MATRAIDDIGVFLPPPARDLLGKAVEMLESRDLQVDDFLRAMLVEKVYAAGVMEKLGDINSFLRDGVEIGIQVSLNTLKAMTAADVAKIVGLIVIAVAVPNLLVLNGPDFISMVLDLGMKLWHLP